MPPARELDPPAAPSWIARLWTRLQVLLALVITGAVLAFLILSRQYAGQSPVEARPAQSPASFAVVGARRIQIQSDTPLARRLEVVEVRQAEITTPLVTVAGTVAASLRPGPDTEVIWQFASPEHLELYSEWEKALDDIAFLTSQEERVRQLALARIDAQQRVVERIERLVRVGTDTEADLAEARVALLETQIEGESEVYEVQQELRDARRTEAMVARQLQQAGLNPRLLQEVTADVDVVLADVPEGYLDRARVGQRCEARFLAVPGEVFTGHVARISPVLQEERRSLRVLFLLDDPDDQLRPGMFAEIGLGTDPRAATLAPIAAMIHVGRADYALRATPEEEVWEAAEVRLGEAHGAEVEVLSGLSPGERILGDGAILLKPAVIESLRWERGVAEVPAVSPQAAAPRAAAPPTAAPGAGGTAAP